MVFDILKRSFSILMKKPFRLWGLSLLYVLMVYLVSIFGILPIITIPITLTLSVGMCAIYLDGIHGNEVSSKQLFAGFKDFKRIAGGMAWMSLWILIWAMIPIVGIVFAIIKAYSYRFTPYILITNKEIGALDALKLSMEKTYGYKGKMFGADIFVSFIIVIGLGILFGLGLIPYVGILFGIINIIVSIIVYALLPLYMGLVSAHFFEEVGGAATMKCPQCGAKYSKKDVFCTQCGYRLNQQ